MDKQTLGFQAEVKQLLQLMIHSLYSNKEIFLRELVSNASDAADKLRFEAIHHDSLFENDSDLKIIVGFDKDARTITISDNGIGMSRDEAIEHLGTIAKSGTQEFFSKLSGDQQKDAALIGQFGVGFYSASSSPTRSRSNRAAPGWRPAKACAGNPTAKAIFQRRIDRQAIARHRHHLASARRRGGVPVGLEAELDHPQILRPHLAADPDAEGRVGRGEEKTVLKDEMETVNQASALWARSKSDITPEQYTEFYKHVSHDFQAPLTIPTTGSKAAANTRSCCTSRRTRRSICGTATSAAASSCTSSASSSWTMPSS